MGSVGNQNPWAPYNNYKDCSQGVCSIYCPQFCYFVFPPPPPENDSAAPFSPLIIAIIGVLATAFLLVSYYTIVTRYCKTRLNQTTSLEIDQNRGGQFRADSASGLDEALINTIAVCKYKKGEGLIEGSECAVCLSEFQENEPLRLLPKCSHAFHLPCIDTWLKSHSNCPLCRAHVVALAHPQSSPPHRVDSDQDRDQVPNELVLVVDDQETVSPISDYDCDGENREDVKETMSEKNGGSDQEGNVSQFRRSISLGTFPFRSHLLISDVVKFEDINNRSKDLQIKRSFSSGGCIFGASDKGKNTILPR